MPRIFYKAIEIFFISLKITGRTGPGAGAIKKRRKKISVFFQIFCDYRVAGAASPESSSLPFRSWSVMAHTAESDQTFSAVSIMSMMV